MRCQWLHKGINVLICHIPSRFWHYTKIRRQLNPPHLKQRWNHQSYGHAWLLWHDIAEIQLFSLFIIYPPKPIFDIPLFLKISAHSSASANHESNTVVHAQSDQLRLPEPSSRSFLLTEGTRPCGVSFKKIRGPVSIWMLWTCGGLQQLATPSFLLAYYLLSCHRVPDMPGLMPPCLWLQQNNEQWICLTNRTHMGPS